MKYSSQEDFLRGFSKNHKHFQSKRVNQQAPRKDFKGKWSKNFMAGKNKKFRAQWSKITSDRWILRTICGDQVELTDKPDQAFVSIPIKFSHLEKETINKEIVDFTKRGIIEPVVQADPDEFISNIFVRPQSDGGIRVILNLEHINQQYVDKIHLKMEILKLMSHPL